MTLIGEVFMEFENLTDEELLQRRRSGDEQAMDFLLEKYKPLVKSKVKSMYLPGADAEDLIQEGMIGLYHAIEGYEEGKDCSFFSFASLVIGRQVMDAVKKANRKKNLPLNSYVSLDVPEDVSSIEDSIFQTFTANSKKNCNPEKIVIDKESQTVLEYELGRCLSPMENEIFQLLCDGYDYREIAEQLGRSLKSVDNALSRIKTKLRKIRQ